MPRYYKNKYKMSSMYNKLCNKQNGLFYPNSPCLHKGQGTPNEF